MMFGVSFVVRWSPAIHSLCPVDFALALEHDPFRNSLVWGNRWVRFLNNYNVWIKRTSRIAVVLPSHPVCNDKVYAHGYNQHDEIFVVRILCQYVQYLR